MQISTKGRYALRLMLDLAVHNTGELVKIKDISARENISEKYLEHTVGTILRLTEGSMKPVACLEDEPNQCSRAGECVTLRLWKMLDEAIEGVLDKVTLQDLKDWYEEMGNDYVI